MFCSVTAPIKGSKLSTNDAPFLYKHEETQQTLQISMSECLTVMGTNTNTHEDRLGVCYELYL